MKRGRHSHTPSGAGRRRRLLGTVIGAFVLALGTAALAVVTDAGTYDVRVATRSDFAEASPANARVQYIGDLNVTYGSAGSGVFNSFVRVQKDPTERGYNTDGDLEFNTKTGEFTHSIKVSEIPTVQVDGTTYWEFFADINDSDNTPLISLDNLEIYLTGNPDITGYPFTGTAEKVYDFAGTIQIRDVNQGGGRADLRYLVDLADISIPAGCSYGNPACTTYLVLYSKWGGSGTDEWASDGGFEEWSVKEYPVLTVTKTIAGTFTETTDWTIDKTPDATYDLFAGDSVDHDYTIALDKTVTASDYAVAGTITIKGDDKDAVTATLADEFAGEEATITGCSVPAVSPGVYVIPKNGTVTCSYTLALDGPVAGTNTATATIDVSGVTVAYTGTATIAADGFTAAAAGEPGTVNVTDDNGSAATGDDTSYGPYSADASTGYTRSFACSTDPADYTGGTYTETVTNTAAIDETTDSDTATVTLNCYLPSVSKTAAGTFTETTDWTIDKTPDATYDLFAGDSVDHDYTIELDKTVTPSDYAVSGTVTIVNPHPDDELVAAFADTLNDGTAVTFDACSNGATLAAGTLKVPAATTTTCGYTASGLAGDETSNTATLTINGIDVSDTEAFTFTAAAAGEPGTVNVTDDNGTAATGDDTSYGPYSDDASTGYTRTFACSTDPADYTDGTYTEMVTNTAAIDGTTDSDTATVTLNCYAPVVSKTAVETFSRDWTWTIDKTGDETSLTLDEGQSFVVDYEVTLGATSVDGDWRVTGQIEVANPHPTEDMELTSVTDVAGGITADVTCPSLTVPAGGILTCTYDTGAQDSPTNPFGATNTATATLGGTGWTGTAPIVFPTTPTSETDECVTVTDSVTGELGTVCADALPVTFTYPLTVGPYARCGSYELENVAELVTNDNAETDSDNHVVAVDVPCPAGCTLTQGYWKTHSGYGPAPYDETWALIDEDKTFFFSGKSYYTVLWTPPQGGNAYYILAHQYIAAELNMLDGAAVPAAVQKAFADATTWFNNSSHTPPYVAGLKGKVGKDVRDGLIAWAGTLASYNEGDLGPGHCDEDSSSDA